MVQHAKSQHEKRRINRLKVIEKLDNAVKAFRALESEGHKPKLRAVAREHDISHVTLGRHLQPGHQSIDEFNTTKQKLSEAQEEQLVWWVIELAN